MVCEKCEKKGKLGKVNEDLTHALNFVKTFCPSGYNSWPMEGRSQQHNKARGQEGGREQVADSFQESFQSHDDRVSKM